MMAQQRIWLGAFTAFTQLRCLELTLSGGMHYQRIKLTLAALPQLQKMMLSEMDITNLGIINTVVGLRELNLDECGGAADLRPLSTLNRLESLSLLGCHNDNLSPISVLMQLKHLCLSRNGPNLTSLAPLSSLTGLRSLARLGLGFRV